MKRLPLIFILLTILVCGCAAPWKAELVESGTREDVIRNAIIDFMNTRSSKRASDTVDAYKIFYASDDKFIHVPGLIIIDIFPQFKREVYPYPWDTVGHLNADIPTQFVKYGGKVFIWRDPSVPVTQELLNMMNEYDLIDTNWRDEEYNIPLGMTDSDWKSDQFYPSPAGPRDDIEAVSYFICDNNFKKYKKDKGIFINKPKSSRECGCE